MNLPAGWADFARSIRLHRARFRCECSSPSPAQPAPCGTDHTTTAFGGRPTERRCHRVDGDALAARGPRARVYLSVVHICSCSPPCLDAAHVLALCQPCGDNVAPDERERASADRVRAAEKIRLERDARAEAALGQGRLW